MELKINAAEARAERYEEDIDIAGSECNQRHLSIEFKLQNIFVQQSKVLRWFLLNVSSKFRQVPPALQGKPKLTLAGVPMSTYELPTRLGITLELRGIHLHLHTP